MRTNGQKPSSPAASGPALIGCAQDGPYPLAESALQSLKREGVQLKEWSGLGDGLPCRWARALAECVAGGECAMGVIFSQDPGLCCCVANKVAGVRAVAVATVRQAAQATLTLGANLLAVEMPGRTYFEVRQILRLAATTSSGCPDGVASTLRELDGRAHR